MQQRVCRSGARRPGLVDKSAIMAIGAENAPKLS
jgi:hypothetical protein